jgi:hypothetical protein
VARSLIKKSIYPSQEEFRKETESVVEGSHSEFYKKFRKNKNSWTIFYEKNIYQRVSL